MGSHTELISDERALGKADQLYFSIFLTLFPNFVDRIPEKLRKMSKGGAGGAAANVLLLKKNEDK